MSQSLSRRIRSVSTALVALVMAVLFATTARADWTEAAHRGDLAGAAREAIVFARAQVRLVEALAATQMQVAAGAKADTAAVAAAVAAVEAAPQTVPGVTARWADLRTRIKALVARPGAGPGAARDWADAVDLAADLLGVAGDAITRGVDADVATGGLIGLAVRDLPAIIVIAGRAADLATPAAGGPLTDQARTELAVDRRLVTDTAARIDSTLPDVAAGGGGELAGQQDAVQAALGAFTAAPDPTGNGYPPNLTALARALQAASVTLAVGLLARADGLIAVRQGAAADDERGSIEIAVIMLAGALVLIWLLSPSRRRAAEDTEAPDDPARPEPIDAASLIDARDLLLEELVHIGRGVRSPTRSSDDDAQ